MPMYVWARGPGKRGDLRSACCSRHDWQTRRWPGMPPGPLLLHHSHETITPSAAWHHNWLCFA